MASFALLAVFLASVGIYGVAAYAVTILAHHSVNREFDTSRTIQVKGVVTRVDWTNPHAWIYIDVAEPGFDRGDARQWDQIRCKLVDVGQTSGESQMRFLGIISSGTC